jgi:TIR domain-containing protein
MKVFISWSGEQSRQFGAAIRDWLPNVLQAVKPYFTPADIEKGTRWDTDISKELEASNYCIIAMTRESLRSLWIPFEAGAISKSVDKSRIYAVTFDILPTDIQGPLTRFQSVKFERGK